MTYAIVIAAMLALVLFCNEFFGPSRVCPMCGGSKKHSNVCPWKEDDL